MSLVKEEQVGDTSKEQICEFGNFVIKTVEEDSEEEVDSDSHKSMPEGESVDDWDLEGSSEGSSMNSSDWDESSEEKEDSECESSIGFREHIDYVNLEAEGIKEKLPDLGKNVCGRLRRAARVLSKKKLKEIARGG